MDERITIPSAALVVLIGAAGSGKSTFARRNFPAVAIVASDVLRRVRRRGAHRRPNDVFDELLEVVDRRLQAGELTVVDATNTDWMRRSELIRLARQYGRPAMAIVFALPLETCLAQNASRSEAIPRHLVRRQVTDLIRDLDRLDLEGFATVVVFDSSDAASRSSVEIERGPVARASGSPSPSPFAGGSE